MPPTKKAAKPPPPKKDASKKEPLKVSATKSGADLKPTPSLRSAATSDLTADPSRWVGQFTAYAAHAAAYLDIDFLTPELGGKHGSTRKCSVILQSRGRRSKLKRRKKSKKVWSEG
eukprot:Gregarina_sp_Poly_1__2087@NODE_154_length_12409_cov_137_944904_g136_i0_p14_GENE_NODE_154_length_12409_cov_137_944904_g136_i0NODE_154_length_12409_cov_137_944904_g136_i0_p14_ORF_typecomplete_len116_score19_70_NODE_154_length_12409_cov_137_944904_g136_i01135411701